MSDRERRAPPRLLDDASASPILQRGIRAARLDAGDADALRRVAARLPLAGGIGLGLAASEAAARGAGPAASSAGLPVAKGVAAWLAGLSPAVGGGIVGGLLGVVVAGGGLTWQALEPAPTPASVAVIHAPPPSNEATPPRDGARSRAPASPAAIAPPAASNASPPRRQGSDPIASSPSPSDAVASAAAETAPEPVKENEARLLEMARRRLAVAPAESLQLTEEHRRAFEHGVLGEEREVIAIEALHRLGQDAAARDRASRFASLHPRSAHLVHIQAMLGSSASP